MVNKFHFSLYLLPSNSLSIIAFHSIVICCARTDSLMIFFFILFVFSNTFAVVVLMQKCSHLIHICIKRLNCVALRHSGVVVVCKTWIMVYSFHMGVCVRVFAFVCRSYSSTAWIIRLYGNQFLSKIYDDTLKHFQFCRQFVRAFSQHRECNIHTIQLHLGKHCMRNEKWQSGELDVQSAQTYEANEEKEGPPDNKKSRSFFSRLIFMH